MVESVDTADSKSAGFALASSSLAAGIFSRIIPFLKSFLYLYTAHAEAYPDIPLQLPFMKHSEC